MKKIGITVCVILICIIALVFVSKVIAPHTKKLKRSKIDLTTILNSIILIFLCGALWVFVAEIVARFS